MAQTKSTSRPQSGSSHIDTEAELRIPQRFDLTGKIHGNPVRKLAFVTHNRRSKVTPVTRGRVLGFMTTDRLGRTTFICSRLTKVVVPSDDVLHLAGASAPDDLSSALDQSPGRWIAPKPVSPAAEDIKVAEKRCNEIIASWRDKFEFRHEHEDEDGRTISGLRLPQIGALHATLAHWSVTHKPATIVMPTGTGKTETMLALLTCARLPRLMVIVPTNALRDQISEKFITLGVLEQCGCLLPGAQLPVVASLVRRPRTEQEVDDIFRRVNVIVTTIQVAGQCPPDVQRRMAELCSHLFIDEAHHIAAKTWKDFKQCFEDKRVIQFTATPFRTDGKRVDGKFIYTYPLAKAQQEGYFRPITFVPIAEYDPDEVARKIARKAVERLAIDLSAGFDHILMARVDTIVRADEIVQIYQQEAAKFNPGDPQQETCD